MYILLSVPIVATFQSILNIMAFTPPTMPSTCLVHTILLDLINRMIFGEQHTHTHAHTYSSTPRNVLQRQAQISSTRLLSYFVPFVGVTDVHIQKKKQNYTPEISELNHIKPSPKLNRW